LPNHHLQYNKATSSFSCLHQSRSKKVHGSTTIVDDKESQADDLTKQDMLLRLAEVRNYYRENPDEQITQADICLKLLCTRLSKLRLNRCYVATSLIEEAGNGVFAGRDIAEGELITLYPGDAVLLQSPTKNDDDADDADADVSSSTPSVVGVMFGNHVVGADRNTSRVATHDARGYEMEINQYTTIVGDPLIGGSNQAYLGHFVNDGASLHEFDTASREHYATATASKCNAAHFVLEGAHMGTVATRDIPKGDEVFVSYGDGYWLSRSDSELTKGGVLVEIKAAVAASEESSRPGERQKPKKKKSSSTRSSSGKKGFGM
jgi:hypothetical protein